MKFKPLPAITIFLLACLAVARADLLSNLPDALAVQLLPVPDISTDMLDPDAREQLAQVRQAVVDAIDQHQDSGTIADAYGELAALYQVQHVYTSADICYQNARTLAPDSFRWTYLHAYLASLNGETEAAVRRYEQARQLRPDYLAVMLRLADAWRDLNLQDKALDAYRQVADSRGLEAAAAFGLGQIALLRREYKIAIEQFDRALELQPEASRIHYTLAQALRASGHDEDARKHLAQVGDRLPAITDPLIDSLQSLQLGSRVHFSQAMKAIKQRDYAGARDAFAHGLEREPGNTDARISYARALYLSGDKTTAGQQLQTIHESHPDNTLVNYLLGILAEEGDDMAKAEDYYTRVIELDPAHAGASFYLANHLYRTGSPRRAVPYYATSIASDPENYTAYLPYAGALLQSGHARTEALAAIDSALRRFPDQPLLRFLHIQLLACSSSVQGCNPDLAVREATALNERQSGPARVELLALAQGAAGDFKAASDLQQALISDAVWMMPTEIERLRRGLSAYQNGELPQDDALFTWKLLQAPQTLPADVFRDYPTPRPY